MFMNDVNKKEEIKSLVIKNLRSFGIKYRPKKQRHNVQATRIGRRVFKTDLRLLPTQTVTLMSGQQLVVPKIVHDLCSFILTKVETEGLFRKGGSRSRQNEIRLSLDSGCCLDHGYHEIDVANILKTFFRELPDPLIPHSHHDLFMRCSLLEDNKLEALLLTCLLLPSEYLNTLAYFMQFLRQITEYSHLNKMDSYNLAVIIGPTLFPVDKGVINRDNFLNKLCNLFKLLIENANNIGYISENIIDQMDPDNGKVSSEEENRNKGKKKRRSGSLTRMFNGLRKMVSSKSNDDCSPPRSKTPDLVSTPYLSKSARKRKLEGGGFSNKKKRELLQNLPQGTILSTPISVNPNPRKKSSPKSNTAVLKEKKPQSNLNNKNSKQIKQNYEYSRHSSGLEHRWFSVSQVPSFKRNKIYSLYTRTQSFRQPPTVNPTNKLDQENLASTISYDVNSEPDYVKIPRTEYEEMKNRVSAIEHRISLELNNYEKQTKTEDANGITNVQTAYEKTLVEAEPLSPTTDQLARRLSKELKIRRSLEQKVVRSPSARKIGSLRRRSKELERQNVKSSTNQSRQVNQTGAIAKGNLKRGKPNTVLTGLRPTRENTPVCESQISTPVTRSVSFHGKPTELSLESSLNLNPCDVSDDLSFEKWTSASEFLSHLQSFTTPDELMGKKSSLVRLRNQNAGNVLAKARLFDELIESDNSNTSHNSSTTASYSKNVNKIGAIRNMDRISQRTRCLKYDEKHPNRQSISPKKKHLRNQKNGLNGHSYPYKLRKDEKENELSMVVLTNTDKAQINVLKDCNRIDAAESSNCTPKGMPHIKKSITIKTPKKICHTPLGHHNKTPMKILTM